MKAIRNYTKKDKVIISIIIGVMSATGAGLLIGAATSSVPLSILDGSTRLGTGFANYGRTVYPESETHDMTMSYTEYIKMMDTMLIEQYQELSEALSEMHEDSYGYREIKKQLSMYADHIGSLNTSFAFLIIGSIIVGISGIAIIGWGSSLMFMGKSKY